MTTGSCKFKLKVVGLDSKDKRDLVYKAFYTDASNRSEVLAVHDTRIKEDGENIVVEGICYGSVYWSLLADSMTSGRVTLMDIAHLHGLTLEIFSSEKETGFEEHCIIRGGRNFTYGRRFTYKGDRNETEGGYGSWKWKI